MEKDYKKMYEDLCNDVRENAMREVCEICAGCNPPCTQDPDFEWFECDTCTVYDKCRCRTCRNNNQWKWRGEDADATE